MRTFLRNVMFLMVWATAWLGCVDDDWEDEGYWCA